MFVILIAAMSVTNSACTSPVFSDNVIHKSMFPINYIRNGYDGDLADRMLPDTLTPVNSQVKVVCKPYSAMCENSLVLTVEPRDMECISFL